MQALIAPWSFKGPAQGQDSPRSRTARVDHAHGGPANSTDPQSSTDSARHSDLAHLRKVVQALIAAAPPLAVVTPSRHRTASQPSAVQSEPHTPPIKRLKPGSPGTTPSSTAVPLEVDLIPPLPLGEETGGPSDALMFRGVSWDKATRNFNAFVHVPGLHGGRKQVSLGHYAKASDAARARDRATLVLQGQDAPLNFGLSAYQDELPRLQSMSGDTVVDWLRTEAGVAHASQSSGFVGVLRTKHAGPRTWEGRVYRTGGKFQTLGRFEAAHKAAVAVDYATLSAHSWDSSGRPNPPPLTNFPVARYMVPGTTRVLRPREVVMEECDQWPEVRARLGPTAPVGVPAGAPAALPAALPAAARGGKQRLGKQRVLQQAGGKRGRASLVQQPEDEEGAGMGEGETEDEAGW